MKEVSNQNFKGHKVALHAENDELPVAVFQVDDVYMLVMHNEHGDLILPLGVGILLFTDQDEAYKTCEQFNEAMKDQLN